ncbi:MAG: alpha/beta hydrolase, partial [Chloroflexi bacterium]|nr:alpha/beta hydrolase [Chloroflexota bacterium]
MATRTQTYEVEIADVEYLNHGETPLLAKVFKPVGNGPFPIMIELHGGAWVNGNRLNGDPANEALAKNGVIVVALDFRVPPEAPYPASLADIHYGIRWAKTQAASWNGNPDRIGAMGTSSGAHQAMLLGMRPNDSRYAALPQPADSADVDGTLACV